MYLLLYVTICNELLSHALFFAYVKNLRAFYPLTLNEKRGTILITQRGGIDEKLFCS